MKKLINKGLGIAFAGLMLLSGTAQKSVAQDVTVSYQTFYDNLSPYGQWVEDPQYGNVWVPNEGGDFRPYGSRGHWVMTDYGNTWVSDDPWGWACYHYGRWTYDNYYGWVWVPGYEWAPAWVTWRYGGGYSGWAPLGPGISIGVSYNCPESWWIFVQPQYMYANDCYSHWRGPGYNGTYIRQTTIINNYYMDNRSHVRYNYGPQRDIVQRDIHQPVQVYHVSQMNRPGAPVVQNNRVSMYRPNVNRATAGTARPANVMQAPRQIGRPQAANNISAGRQPEFRQQVQRQQGQPQQSGANPRDQRGVNNHQPGGMQQSRPQNTGVVNPRDSRGNNNQPSGRPQPQYQNREPQRQQPQMQQPQNRPQPQYQTRQEPMRQQPQMQQPQNRPQPQYQTRQEPQRQQPQMQQPQKRPQPQYQTRQEPMRQQPQMQQPQNRPEPQRQQPQMQQPQSRPQPQYQNREPMRQQPQMQPQNRPEPMRQPQMQPQGRPQMQPQGRPEGHEGGRR